MIVNKKFDRLRQWGRERMGGEVRTDTNDEFKSLEIEMQLRGEGELIVYAIRLPSALADAML